MRAGSGMARNFDSQLRSVFEDSAVYPRRSPSTRAAAESRSSDAAGTARKRKVDVIEFTPEEQHDCGGLTAIQPFLFEREFPRECQVEAEGLGLAARLDRIRHPLEPRRNLHQLLLRRTADRAESLERLDLPPAELFLHDLEVVARTVNLHAAHDVGEVAEVRHLH